MNRASGPDDVIFDSLTQTLNKVSAVSIGRAYLTECISCPAAIVSHGVRVFLVTPLENPSLSQILATLRLRGFSASR
jgi:hypothetical protein